MTLPMLREDALFTTAHGFGLRLSLPWIRSLPVAGISDLRIIVDGAPVDDPLVALGGRIIAPADLASERGEWYVQDRLILHAHPPIEQGPHEVTVSYRLLIPYLPGGPDAPLTLPFATTRTLVLDAVAAVPTVSRDVA